MIKRASKKKGLTPGSLVYVGDRPHENTRITLINYDKTQFQEKEISDIKECLPFKDKPSITWINIDGLNDTAPIAQIGEHFNLHPLIMEDILNTSHRPKLEDFGEYLFIVIKMSYYSEKNSGTVIEQVSLVLGPNFVISFQEKSGDVFDHIRERIRNDIGRIRENGADYLLYCLLDAIVDGNFVVLEKIGDRIEALEEIVVTDPKPAVLTTIHQLKREMIFLRKSTWPLREVINNLSRNEVRLIHDTTIIYLRDVYDHTIQIIDTIETYRDMLAGLHDTYLSSISNKMNEIMKVLTIFASIFIPLTFITGIYGMNFRHMPELTWSWGYLGVWGLMLAVGIGMILYFKRKGWL